MKKMLIVSESYNFFMYCQWIVEHEEIDLEKVTADMTCGISGRKKIRDVKQPVHTEIFIERVASNEYRFVQIVHDEFTYHTYSEAFKFIDEWIKQK